MKKILIMLLAAALLYTTACTVQVADRDKENEPASAVQETEIVREAGDGVIYFDAASAGWENASDIFFFISDLDTGERAPWGSKQLAGTAEKNSVRSFDAADLGVQEGHAYIVILEHADTHDQTYPLVMDTTCFGDTIVADQQVLEDPSDSNKKTYEARWKHSSLGPICRITSIGNVVGETVPVNTAPYRMLVDFLASRQSDGLSHALAYNSKTPQETIDHVAGELRLTKEDVKKAITEAKTIGHTETGDKTDWSKGWKPQKSKLPEEADKSNQTN